MEPGLGEFLKCTTFDRLISTDPLQPWRWRGSWRVGYLQLSTKRTGTAKADIFKYTVMIDDMEKWPIFTEVYVSYVEPRTMPACIALGAVGLALGAPIEVECMVYAPLEEKSGSPFVWVFGLVSVGLAFGLGLVPGRRNA